MSADERKKPSPGSLASLDCPSHQACLFPAPDLLEPSGCYASKGSTVLVLARVTVPRKPGLHSSFESALVLHADRLGWTWLDWLRPLTNV